MWHVWAPLIRKAWILRRWYARAMLSRYPSATRKLFVYGLLHTQFPLFSNTLLCPRNFCELVILCVVLLCPNNLVHCYRNVRETQCMPNKPKACPLWPTYRLTSVSVNTPSNSSATQSQTKIVGTLKPSAVFFPSRAHLVPLKVVYRGFGHQILYTNIEGTRRPQSVPTILTDTVAQGLFKMADLKPSMQCKPSPTLASFCPVTQSSSSSWGRNTWQNPKIHLGS